MFSKAIGNRKKRSETLEFYDKYGVKYLSLLIGQNNDVTNLILPIKYLQENDDIFKHFFSALRLLMPFFRL